MKTKIFLSAFFLSIILIGFYSCKKENVAVQTSVLKLNLPESPYSYSSINGSNDKLITLGRVLFYDTHLSINNSISCATCHKQAYGFSDNTTFSRGFENKLTSRNSIAIQNLFNFSSETGGLFWDGRETFLSSMVLKPITNHIEMGMNDDNAIAERVKKIPYYNQLFVDAFDGDSKITADRIANALAAFCGSIESKNTKFDQAKNGTASLSSLELEGSNLFFTKYNCASCHQSTAFAYYGSIGSSFINIGLDENYSDKGRGAKTGLESDNGKFKVPSLRNIALTAPYMHDGRFATLSEVLDHYSHGIANNPNLDERLKATNGLPIQMNISEQEKTALIAFLNTLTDYSLVKDVRFSSPFVTQ